MRTELSRKLTFFGQDVPYHSIAVPLWDLEGKHVYVIRHGVVWKVDVIAGGAQELTKLTDLRVISLVRQSAGLLYSAGSSWTVALTRNERTGRTSFYRIDVHSGNASLLYSSGECFSCVRVSDLTDVAANGSELAFFSGDAAHDTDLWLTDAEFTHPHPLTKINPQFAEYSMGAARMVEWHSLDGEELRGALLLPSGYESGKRYPLVVKIYGGVDGSATLGVFGLERGLTNLQLLATRGYAVLFPDAPTRLGTPMLDLAKAVLPGINKVIEMGVADPTRIGIIGHSYGGYSTLALLVQTSRFKAAVESAGYGDLAASYGELADNGSAYGVAILERGQGLMGGLLGASNRATSRIHRSSTSIVLRLPS